MKYKTIYADPPWPLHGGGGRGIQTKYQTMTIPKIKLIGDWLDQITADDSHLYMWVVSSFLLEGIEVMNAWGYEPVTNFIWVKDSIGMGHYARSQHEILLFGKKGKTMLPEKSNLSASIIHAPRGKHSAKPHKFYDLIEGVSPGHYLELFARNKREGWHSWGNELVRPDGTTGEDACDVTENFGFWQPPLAA